jgi:hypothetical protein
MGRSKRLRAAGGTGCPPVGVETLLLIAGTYRMRTAFSDDGSAPAWDTRSPAHLSETRILLVRPGHEEKGTKLPVTKYVGVKELPEDVATHSVMNKVSYATRASFYVGLDSIHVVTAS